MTYDIIRRTILRPYRKGIGPTFTLTIYGPGHMRGNRWNLDYRLTQRDGRKSVTLFEGSDFCPSPLHAWDSDDTVASLLSFLTLRPGDTDAEYFDGYTDAQRDFCAKHAEALSCEVIGRFGER